MNKRAERKCALLTITQHLGRHLPTTILHCAHRHTFAHDGCRCGELCQFSINGITKRGTPHFRRRRHSEHTNFGPKGSIISQTYSRRIGYVCCVHECVCQDLSPAEICTGNRNKSKMLDELLLLALMCHPFACPVPKIDRFETAYWNRAVNTISSPAVSIRVARTAPICMHVINYHRLEAVHSS